ncbi:MAG: D-alanyl-D-alanine carboxypeptidase family protein [Parvibaculaceae bacterium]
MFRWLAAMTEGRGTGSALRALAALCLLIPAAARAEGVPSLVFEPQTGRVLLEERSSEPWRPASLTKLMTAYLTFSALKAGTLKLDQRISVSAEAEKVEPSKIGMPAGSQISVDLALKSLLVYSANDMAVVLAEGIAGTMPKFVEAMNAAAKRFGMSGTYYANPHGLNDPRQVTTARDIGVLVSHIIREFPEYSSYFSAPFVQVGKRKLSNRNALLRQMPAADGMKTGFICDSGYNLVGSATLEGRRLVAVVLGAKSGKARADLAQLLLESGAAEFASGLVQDRPLLATLPDTAAGTKEPESMRDTVCKGADLIAYADPRQIAGWGVSFGRYPTADRADAVLSGRLLATRKVFMGGASGVMKVPGTKDFAAVVWSMEQPTTLTLCNYLRTRHAYCEVVPPETFSGLSAQAIQEEEEQRKALAAAAAAKSKTKARKKPKRPVQVPQPASGQ